jgi:hypothetical protein
MLLAASVGGLRFYPPDASALRISFALSIFPPGKTFPFINVGIIIDFLRLFALTVLEQLHSQPVVENWVGEYQVEKLVEIARPAGK